MANSLIDLFGDAYAAVNQVGRELTGHALTASKSLSNIPVALNQDIVIPLTRRNTSSAVVPQMNISEPPDRTVDNVKVRITNSETSEFGYIGEEYIALNSGVGQMSLQADEIAEAVRVLVNKVELAVATEAYQGASRAFGIAGTTPFGSNHNELAEIAKIMKDNGAPTNNMGLVLDTTAGVNLSNLTSLNKVNEAGNDTLLRQNMIGGQPLKGFGIRETSASIIVPAGTATGATVTGVNAIGTTTIDMTTAGGGSIVLVKGQYLTIAGDTNKYVIAVDVTIGAATTGDVVIAAPGLREATAGTEVVTASVIFSPNVAYNRSAIQLIARPPAIPEGGDARADSFIVTDAMSGLSIRVSKWLGQYKNKYDVGLAWGVKAIKTEDIVTLLG